MPPRASVLDELTNKVYGERSHFVDSIRRGSINNPERRSPDEPRVFGLTTPLQDSAGMVTPASLHYVISHGYEPRDIDPKEHRLLIHGMVDRPMTLSLDELQRLPSVSRFHFIECHGNSIRQGARAAPRISPDATAQDTHGFTSCSQWTGVLLSLLLEQAGVQKGGTWIIAEGADEPQALQEHSDRKSSGRLRLWLTHRTENRCVLSRAFPMRLIIPGWQGINNVKWLRRINLVDEPYMAMMESEPDIRSMMAGWKIALV